MTGSPGCGKTTLLNRLALAFAEGRADADLGWRGKALFPLFLRLRNFGAFIKQKQADFPEPSSGALIAYLENQLRVGERILLTADFLERRLDEGNCLVLMDGLDEVTDLRSEVAGHIDAFIDRYGNRGNRFGLSSRPRGYETVELQLRRCNLAEAVVNPLDLRGIRELVGNLLVLIEQDQSLRSRDQDDLVRSIRANEELTRIAGTPLFCSALVQVYKYHGAHLPNRRVDVFDEIVDLLLGFWRAQQRHLSQAEQLASEDGTGRHFREVKDAVAVKHRRLSYLADHMQCTRQAEIAREEAENVIYEYLKQRERVPDDATARTWAENFLVNSHELSGLLVEVDPGIYIFLHKGFMEYLAASALVNQSRTLVETILKFITDEWWEQVILLAGAHPKLAEDVRSELIRAILDKSEECPKGSEDHLRYLVMAGRLARDMDEYLPGPEHELIEGCLLNNAVDRNKNPSFRADCADTLDELGYTPDNLYTFVPVSETGIPGFLIARYPVTNAQYARFLKPENFENRDYWCDFPMFDQNSQPVKGKTWGNKGWDWLQRELVDRENLVEDGVLVPRYWRDPRFGSARPSAPVVGVSWYEANAYCKWLLARWDELEEGRQGLPKPGLIRLPARREWAVAAGGAEPKERFPWDRVGQAESTKKDDGETLAAVVQRANVIQSGINRTTPVWMYPQGESQPYRLLDLGGNIWEWHANYADKDHDVLRLSGGAWGVYWNNARVSERDDDRPSGWVNYIGFRVLALPSVS